MSLAGGVYLPRCFAASEMVIWYKTILTKEPAFPLPEISHFRLNTFRRQKALHAFFSLRRHTDFSTLKPFLTRKIFDTMIHQQIYLYIFKFILGSEAWGNKTKQMYYSLLTLKMISFALFPQARQSSVNFNISKFVYSNLQQWKSDFHSWEGSGIEKTHLHFCIITI